MESAGEMLNRVKRLRDPASLAALWPFYGASMESLAAISNNLAPDVAFEGTVLCEPPMDPCQTLTIVVHGKIALLRASPPGGNAEGISEKAGIGATFGEFEFLPAPKEGSIQDIILSKQSPVQRAKAIEFSVIMQVIAPSRFHAHPLPSMPFPGLPCPSLTVRMRILGDDAAAACEAHLDPRKGRGAREHGAGQH